MYFEDNIDEFEVKDGFLLVRTSTMDLFVYSEHTNGYQIVMKENAEHYALSEKEKRLAICYKQKIIVYTLDRAEEDVKILCKNEIIVTSQVGQIALDECGDRLVICDESGCTIQIYLTQKLPFDPKPAMAFIRGSYPVKLVGKM